MAAEDYFPVDDYDDDSEWGGWQPRRPSRPRCNRCGAVCEWVSTGAGWRLFNVSGGPHHCGMTPDAFDDVSEEAAPPPPLV